MSIVEMMPITPDRPEQTAQVEVSHESVRAVGSFVTETAFNEQHSAYDSYVNDRLNDLEAFVRQHDQYRGDIPTLTPTQTTELEHQESVETSEDHRPAPQLAHENLDPSAIKALMKLMNYRAIEAKQGTPWPLLDPLPSTYMDYQNN